MIFDFTNYTFSGLLSILASLYGVSYPLIMQSIGRIYTQYDSTLLANRFTKETIYRVFQVLLILNLLFAVSTPFLLHAEWWNIGFVTIQAILLVLLMGFTFLLFQLMIKYENAGELLRHIEGGQIDKSNVMDIFDTECSNRWYSVLFLFRKTGAYVEDTEKNGENCGSICAASA